jgi:acyl dehydratase
VLSLRERLGQEAALSDWLEVTQEQIGQFAQATGDMQWIHVDQERATAESPFRTTIAHGFLTLSLVSTLFRSAIRVQGLKLSVNYGLNRVRFVSPVPSGARIRARFTPLAVEQVSDAVQVTWSVAIEREGAERVACVAEWLVRYYPSATDAETGRSPRESTKPSSAGLPPVDRSRIGMSRRRAAAICASALWAARR